MQMLTGLVLLLIESQPLVTVHLFGGNLVTWRSTKQTFMTRSSAEAEFRVVAQVICELLWLTLLLEELKVEKSQPMKLTMIIRQPLVSHIILCVMIEQSMSKWNDTLLRKK